MPKYRKKPVVIDALQYAFDTPEGALVAQDAVADFMEANVSVVGDQIEIGTLEGTMYASNGDWIIKGVKGEFYPCKPDIFAATYEPAEAA